MPACYQDCVRAKKTEQLRGKPQNTIIVIDEGNHISLVTETVNWLHYLNYEAIASTSSACY